MTVIGDGVAVCTTAIITNVCLFCKNIANFANPKNATIMKRFTIVAMLLIGASIFSSRAMAQGMRFGVFFDPQISWFSSDHKDFDPNGPEFGYRVGFTADKFFAERYAFSTGLSINSLSSNVRYAKEGYTLKTNEGKYTIAKNANVKVRIQYLSVPLELKFKTIEIGYNTFYVHMGLTAHVRYKAFAWEKWNDISKETITASTDPIFLSYQIGGGIEHSLGGPTALQLGFVYSGGITNAFDTGSGKVSLSNVALRLGIIF